MNLERGFGVHIIPYDLRVLEALVLLTVLWILAWQVLYVCFCIPYIFLSTAVSLQFYVGGFCSAAQPERSVLGPLQREQISPFYFLGSWFRGHFAALALGGMTHFRSHNCGVGLCRGFFSWGVFSLSRVFRLRNKDCVRLIF